MHLPKGWYMKNCSMSNYRTIVTTKRKQLQLYPGLASQCIRLARAYLTAINTMQLMPFYFIMHCTIELTINVFQLKLKGPAHLRLIPAKFEHFIVTFIQTFTFDCRFLLANS